MAGGVRIHGKRGLIYLSGVELLEASAVTISHTTDSEEGPSFGDQYPLRAVGLFHWAGTITSWAVASQKAIQNAAQAGFSIPLLAYPHRADKSDYYSGNIVVSFEHGIDVGSIQGITASYEGDGDLNTIGFD